MRLPTAARRGVLTPALPMPYPALENAGLRLRRGQTSLWIAAPGVGKSQFLNNIAQRAGVPTCYWSADTDAHDVVVRTTALWTGKTISEVERDYKDALWAPYFESLLDEKGSHVDWVFESSITPRHVGERMNAFAESHGEYPHLFVVDNLSNTVEHQSDELAEQKEVMTAMQKLARDSKAHIAILAHAKGIYDSGDKPIPQAGSLNNLFKTPSIGVTMHRADAIGNHVALNVVKNRGGRGDPGANHPITFEVDFSRATVRGFR